MGHLGTGRPTFGFAACAQRSVPCWRAFPAAEKSPLSETETPIVMGVDAGGDPLVPPLVPHAERTRANPAAIIDTGLRMLPPFLPTRLVLSGFGRLFLALNKRLFYLRQGPKDCQ